MVKTVDGIKCLICGDEIWSCKVHDFKWCKCHTVAIEGGQKHLKVTGMEKDYKVIKIETIEIHKGMKNDKSNSRECICGECSCKEEGTL